MNKDELNFKHVMEKLVEVAEADGKVTEEEEDLIKSMKKEVERYQKALNEAKIDDQIAEDEWHDLVILRDSIMTKALETESDSQDVNDLLQTLWDEVNKHPIPGSVEDELPDDE